VPVIPVSDDLDPRLGDYRNLPDRELLTRRGLFIAEGRLVVERLLARRGWVTRSVLVTDTARIALHDVLEARTDVPVYVVSPELMSGVAGVHIHRGALAVGERPAPGRWQDLAAPANRLVVLERIGNADNVGAIFRAAAAFGVDGVLLDAASADPLYRKAIRTSMGAALAVPFAKIGIGEDPGTSPAAGVADVVRELGATGWTVVGLTPSPSAPVLSAAVADLGNHRVAFLVGHEGDGLTPGAFDACQSFARIPMPGRDPAGVDSLNVAMAVAIALYELTRNASCAASWRPEVRAH
jgi:tRNA G18 (ribose-2'-O)-methylase SpoU